MLCELVDHFEGPLRFVQIWMLVSSIMLFSVFLSSGLVFYHLYWPSKVTYEKWRYKVTKSSSQNSYTTNFGKSPIQLIHRLKRCEMKSFRC